MPPPTIVLFVYYTRILQEDQAGRIAVEISSVYEMHKYDYSYTSSY